MQDWRAATAALALAGPNRNHNIRLFLTLHNSYDSGPIKPEDLQGVGIDPDDVPAPVTKSTVLGRAMPLIEKPFFTVSEQFARDLTEDTLQTQVMFDHLQDDSRPPNLVGVNNGPFTSLAVPETPALAEARRRNYGPLRDWKRQKKQEALVALNQFRKTKDLIKALLCFATDAAKRSKTIQDLTQLQTDESKKAALGESLRGTVTSDEKQKELLETLDLVGTSEDLLRDIAAVLNADDADDPKPVWGNIAKFVAKANASPDMPWFVLAGRDDTRQKGYDVAAEAIRNFLTKPGNDDKAQFLFFPIPGDEGREGLLFLRRLAEDYRANILVLTFIFQEGYMAALQGAAFGVMPSLYEPFGMANEFYLNGAVGIGRATGGLLQQIVPLREVPSFAPEVDSPSSHWHSPSVAATGLLYRESDNNPDVVGHWKAFNGVQYLSEPGQDRVAERRNYRLFADMAGALQQALADAIDVYREPLALNSMQPYYAMLVAGIGHIQRGFSWEWAAAEYNSYLV